MSYFLIEISALYDFEVNSFSLRSVANNFRCLKCCFWCLEKCLRFLNKNAYIMVGSIIVSLLRYYVLKFVGNASRFSVELGMLLSRLPPFCIVYLPSTSFRTLILCPSFCLAVSFNCLTFVPCI